MNDNGGMGVYHHPSLSDVLPWQVERGAYAYQAYKRASAGRSTITGVPLPDWKDLGPDTMRAWWKRLARCARASVRSGSPSATIKAMSFWDTLGHFFAHLFPHNAKEAQTLLTEISPYVNMAGPICQAIETDLKPLLTDDQVKKAETLNAFLGKYIHKADQLETVVNQLLAQPDAKVMLRDAAKAVLTALLPAPVSVPLNLVIETAYELYVVKQVQTNSAPALPAPRAA